MIVVDSESASNKPNRLNDAIESIFARRWIVPAAVVIAMVLRLTLVALTGTKQRFYDESEYWSIADSIVHGNGFSLFGHLTAYRPPAMPYLLAGGMLVFGERYWVFALLQALIICILPFLIFHIAEMLGLSTAYASLAAVMVAFHPGLNYASTTIYPTAITTIAIALSTLLALKSIERDSNGYGIAAGAAAGLAGFATTIFVPYGVILALVAFLRRRVRVAVCIAIMSLLPTVAWVVRNHAELHTYSVATNGGLNMELGANDQAEPRSGNLITAEPVSIPGQPSEVDIDKTHHDRAIVWIEAHRARFAELIALRSVAVLDSVGKPATRGVHDSLAAKLLGWAMLPFVLLSLLGLLRYRRSSLALMTMGCLLLIVISSALTIVKPRFRFPCDPLLFIFAVAAIQSLIAPADVPVHEPADTARLQV